MFQKYLLYILLIPFLFFAIWSCNKQNETKTSTNERNNYNDSLITMLNNEGVSYYNSGDLLSSQQSYNKADSLLTPTTDTSLRVSLLFNMGKLLKRQGKYEESIANYYEAARISQLTGDSSKLGMAYYNISTAYFSLKKIKEASKYNTKAKNILKTTQNKKALLDCYVQQFRMNSNDKNRLLVKKHLNNALQYYKEHNQMKSFSICLNNYAGILFSGKQYNEAIHFYTKAISISKKLNDKTILSISLGNIGELYLTIGQLDSAKFYIDSSMKIAKNRQTILNNLDRLISYYKAIDNSDSIIKVTERFYKLQIEILKQESSDIAKRVEEKYKNKLALIKINNKVKLLKKDKLAEKKKQERANLILYFIIFISLLIIGVSYILYRKQKRISTIDKKLHAREYEILESKNRLALSELKNKEIEKKRLEEELNFKRQELISFSLNLSEREKYLDNLKNVFSEIKEGEVLESEVLQKLRSILYGINNDKSEIYNRIEELNSSFYFNLKRNFPNLNDDDIRLASLLLLDFSSKEISTVFNIEPKSVDMKRYRLKKKLNIGQETDITTFLKGL